MNRRKRRVNPVPPAMRNLFVLALFAIAAVALEGRLVWILFTGEVDGRNLIEEGQARQFREVAIPVRRAMFTDRHGQPLAISTPVDNIWVDPQKISAEREAIFSLARALDIDGEELARDVTSNKDSQFLLVQRAMPPQQAAAIMELGLTGVHTQDEYKRFWPMHEITCQLVGFTDTEDKGIQGLEHDFDFDLTGEPGLKIQQRDLKGRLIADIQEEVPARPGADIALSIDMALQYPAHRALKTVAEQTGASTATLVMLDVATGEVLAMVNQPSCNPNDADQKSDLGIFRNFAIRDQFEPGSAIKPLILAGWLEQGFPADALIPIPEEVEVGTQILIDERRDPAGDTLTNILARSSNPGMVTISRQLEAEAMWQALKNFGFAGPTGSGLGTSEAQGQLDDYQIWCSACKDTISYGYGLSVTTLQLARAYAAIASGGLLPPVSVVALYAPPQRVRIMSEETATQLAGMLEGVVDGDQATARLAAIPNYRVAGKTGTARMSGPGGYSDRHHRAIFAGFAPASNPRFVAVVVIEDPQGNEYYGGQIAAPVFAEVMETALRLYGVPPDDLPGQQDRQLTSELAEDR